MKIQSFLLVILCSTIGLFAQNNFVYTNDDNAPNTVSAFNVNSNGSLTLIPGSPFLTGGNGSGDSKIDPGKITTATVGGAGFVYAANTADGTVTGFSVNPQTGALLVVPGSPFPIGAPNSNPSLASSPNGAFFFAADDVNPVVHVFSISSTGALTEVAGSPFNVGAPAQGLKVSPSGQFLAVGLEPNAVGIFAIGSQGTLTAAPGSQSPTSGIPQGVEINCHSNRVFVANGGSSGPSLINSFQMSEDGSLTPTPGSPFPSGGSFINVALALTPNNNFLLTSDTFGDSVSSLAVGANGALQQVPGSPFGADDFVGKIATTRAGNFVYASLFADGAVDGWSISATGTLAPTPGRPYSTGQGQLGMSSLVTFPAPTCPAQ